MAKDDEEISAKFKELRNWCYWTIYYAIMAREELRCSGNITDIDKDAVERESIAVAQELWTANFVECQNAPKIGLGMLVKSVFRFVFRTAPHLSA